MSAKRPENVIIRAIHYWEPLCQTTMYEGNPGGLATIQLHYPTLDAARL
jgi:hypothetical protein